MDDLSPEKLTAAVHQALKNWHNVDEQATHHLGQLRLVHQERIAVGLANPAARRLATNHVLEKGIKLLELRKPELALILRKRFVEKVKVTPLSQQLHISPDTLKRRQRVGLRVLTEVLLEQEIEQRNNQVTQWFGRLESPTYSELFGIKELTERVAKQLMTPQRKEVIMLTGLGGIGKTSLANHVVRQVLPHFLYEAVEWLSIHEPPAPNQPIKDRYQWLVRQLVRQILPQISSTVRPEEQVNRLRHVLKHTPTLIVIDNLELKADTSFLLANLVSLSTPSKFFLTSRTQPIGLSGVLMHTLNELSFSDAVALVRHHGAELGLHDLEQASDEAIRPIYQAVGGNPFALKLVVGLSRIRSLPLVLRDLQAKGSAELFNKIFWQAWRALSEPAQKLLTIMPLSAKDGVTDKQLEQDEIVDQEHLWAALNELVSYSLIEVRGTVWERRYYIHYLTELFLRSEILR